jgi:REP element-mobilizing transposase RayT
MAYLITFTCYGARLHGDASGSVDREQNVYGTPFLPVNPIRVASEQGRGKEPPYLLDPRRRTVVLEAVMELCLYRGWRLLAIHVRSQHVHLVVAGEDAPEKILGDTKKYASRALNRAAEDGANRRRWTRHGSTRYLWKSESVGAAIHYVVREQGDPMAVWERPDALV